MTGQPNPTIADDPEPYTIIDGVDIESGRVDETRQRLARNGFSPEFLHVDPRGGPTTDTFARGVKAYEIYRHADGRVMAIRSRLGPRSRRNPTGLEFRLNEVRLKPDFQQLPSRRLLQPED